MNAPDELDRMNLTIDCALSAEKLDWLSNSAWPQWLAKSKYTMINKPLAALVCEQYGLPALPDYPIAAISGSADGLQIEDAYWLCADPVHFILQRDCFSLDDTVPIQLTREETAALLATLNGHFNQDGLQFFAGHSGAWYLRLSEKAQISTTLPSVAIGKNVQTFMPRGLDSLKWRAIMNEVQMLLFEHPINLAREANGEKVVNSVWFSGGGVMPPIESTSKRRAQIIANHPFYQGLATWSQAPYQVLSKDFEAILESQVEHVHYVVPDDVEEMKETLTRLLSILNRAQLKKLRLQLGYYDKCLIADIQPLDRYKFWHTAKPLSGFYHD